MAGAHQGRAPGEEQARIVRRVFEQWLQNINYLGIIFQHGIAQAQDLTDERVLRMRPELALESRNSFSVALGAEAGQAPIAVQTGKIGLPLSSLPEKLCGFGKFRFFGPHHAQIVIGTAQDFSDK